MESAEVLALVGGHVDYELLARNEYLAAENEIMRSKIQKSIQLNKEERIRLAEIGRRIGLKALKDVSTSVKPETVMEWFRKLVAKKFDGSGKKESIGIRASEDRSGYRGPGAQDGSREPVLGL